MKNNTLVGSKSQRWVRRTTGQYGSIVSNNNSKNNNNANRMRMNNLYNLLLYLYIDYYIYFITVMDGYGD